MPTSLSDCLSTSTLTLGTAADESSTPVALDISYSAETNSSFIEDFETELVDELIRTAVFAIFGCNPETRGKVAPNTEESDGERTKSRNRPCFECSSNSIPLSRFLFCVDGLLFGSNLRSHCGYRE